MEKGKKGRDRLKGKEIERREKERRNGIKNREQSGNKNRKLMLLLSILKR